MTLAIFSLTVPASTVSGQDLGEPIPLPHTWNSGLKVEWFDLDLGTPGYQQAIVVNPAQILTADINFQRWSGAGNPNEINQVFFVYSWEPTWNPPPIYDTLWNGVSGSYPGTFQHVGVQIQAPSNPGTYYIWVRIDAMYNMQDAVANIWNKYQGPPPHNDDLGGVIGRVSVLPSQFDFSVRVEPPSQTIRPGESATYTVFVELTSEASQEVRLREGCSAGASHMPGVSCTFSPESGIPPFSSIFTVVTNQTVPLGTFIMDICAYTPDNESFARCTTYTLEIVTTQPPNYDQPWSATYLEQVLPTEVLQVITSNYGSVPGFTSSIGYLGPVYLVQPEPASTSGGGRIRPVDRLFQERWKFCQGDLPIYFEVTIPPAATRSWIAVMQYFPPNYQVWNFLVSPVPPRMLVPPVDRLGPYTPAPADPKGKYAFRFLLVSTYAQPPWITLDDIVFYVEWWDCDAVHSCVCGGVCMAVATYGQWSSVVVYMRYVRDGVIGSSPTGAALVRTWNAFYYSWSPYAARAIATNDFVRDVFGILLLPLVEIVHIAEVTFISVVETTGTADLASTVSFLVAASLSTIIYIVAPGLALIKLASKRRVDGQIDSSGA